MIYTSYFGNIEKCESKVKGLRFCSIAGITPDWFLNYKYNFQFKLLAPKYNWWKEWYDKFIFDLNSIDSQKWYTEKYKATVLDKLNPMQVCVLLNNESDNHDVCLLCYETPEKFCHRHLVCNWLNDHGIECRELT